MLLCLWLKNPNINVLQPLNIVQLIANGAEGECHCTVLRNKTESSKFSIKVIQYALAVRFCPFLNRKNEVLKSLENFSLR